jgi:hypothetical protein
MSTLFNLPTPPLKSSRPSRSSNTTSESLVRFDSIHFNFSELTVVSQTDLLRTRNSLHDTLVYVTGENDPYKTAESYRTQTINAGLGRDNVDPTAVQNQNGIRIHHGPIIDVPRISGRLPSYSMQEGRTANSEPRWDRPLYFVVRRNDAQYPSISFFPHDGLGAGVAMGLAFYQEGMLMKQSSIESCLPPILRHIEFLPFTLRVRLSSGRSSSSTLTKHNLVAWLYAHLGQTKPLPH